MDLLPALCPYRPVVPAAWDLLQLPCLLPALPVSICRAVVLQGFPKKDSCCPRRWAASRFWADPPPPVAKKSVGLLCFTLYITILTAAKPLKGFGPCNALETQISALPYDFTFRSIPYRLRASWAALAQIPAFLLLSFLPRKSILLAREKCIAFQMYFYTPPENKFLQPL